MRKYIFWIQKKMAECVFQKFCVKIDWFYKINKWEWEKIKYKRVKPWSSNITIENLNKYILQLLTEKKIWKFIREL